jgi:hypothetical protein
VWERVLHCGGSRNKQGDLIAYGLVPTNGDLNRKGSLQTRGGSLRQDVRRLVEDDVCCPAERGTNSGEIRT